MRKLIEGNGEGAQYSSQRGAFSWAGRLGEGDKLLAQRLPWRIGGDGGILKDGLRRKKPAPERHQVEIIVKSGYWRGMAEDESQDTVLTTVGRVAQKLGLGGNFEWLEEVVDQMAQAADDRDLVTVGSNSTAEICWEKVTGLFNISADNSDLNLTFGWDQGGLREIRGRSLVNGDSVPLKEDEIETLIKKAGKTLAWAGMKGKLVDSALAEEKDGLAMPGSDNMVIDRRKIREMRLGTQVYLDLGSMRGQLKDISGVPVEGCVCCTYEEQEKRVDVSLWEDNVLVIQFVTKETAEVEASVEVYFKDEKISGINGVKMKGEWLDAWKLFNRAVGAKIEEEKRQEAVADNNWPEDDDYSESRKVMERWELGAEDMFALLGAREKLEARIRFDESATGVMFEAKSQESGVELAWDRANKRLGIGYDDRQGKNSMGIGIEFGDNGQIVRLKICDGAEEEVELLDEKISNRLRIVLGWLGDFIDNKVSGGYEQIRGRSWGEQPAVNDGYVNGLEGIRVPWYDNKN